jgi:hypothetical protein
VKFIDPTGMEGEDPPTNAQKQNNRNPAQTIKTIFAVSEWYTDFKKNFTKYTKGYYDRDAKVTGGITDKPGYTSDSEEGAFSGNLWVNNRGIFYMDNYTDINTAEFANYLLGCMIYGVGFENIVFPTDGTVSSSLKGAGIVNDALDAFYEINRGKSFQLETLKDEFSGTTLSNNFKSIFSNGFFHPETFIGSATITVASLNNKELMVTIFNITSLTSGDFMKHIPGNKYPLSIVRDSNLPQGSVLNQYGNISQTYSFTIPIDLNRLKK